MDDLTIGELDDTYMKNFEILETKTYGKSKLTIIKLLELSSIK